MTIRGVGVPSGLARSLPIGACITLFFSFNAPASMGCQRMSVFVVLSVITCFFYVLLFEKFGEVFEPRPWYA